MFDLVLRKTFVFVFPHFQIFLFWVKLIVYHLYEGPTPLDFRVLWFYILKQASLVEMGPIMHIMVSFGPFWVALCCAPLYEKPPKHHRHKGDPRITLGTCGAICERAQAILVWQGHWALATPPTYKD